MNREIAFEAATIATALRRDGTPIELPDVFIGATARVTNEPIVTRNAAHFERIDGIDVWGYELDDRE